MRAALADPTRCRVVQLLSQGPRRAGEISDSAGVSGPRMSRHLRVLRLRPDSIVAVQAWLDQLRAQWRGRGPGAPPLDLRPS